MIWCVFGLAVLCCVCAAAALYWKQEWKDEHDRKWMEIAESLTWQNQYLRTVDAKQIYADVLSRVVDQRDELQRKLSAVLCPSDIHIWKNGVCTRCGATREDVYGSGKEDAGC